MRHLYLAAIIIFSLFAACKKKNYSNKYDALNGNLRVTGKALLAFPGSSYIPSLLANVPIYLNDGNDTVNHIYQTTTDSTGKYSIPFLKKEHTYTIFTRFIRNGILYAGSANFKPYGDIVKDIEVFPQYTNGFAITVKDSLGGIVPKLHLRLYTSKIAALNDYAKDVVADTITDQNGQFIKYNVTPLMYYVLITDSIGGLKFTVLDSVKVEAAQIAEKTIVSSPVIGKNGLTIATTDALGNKMEAVTVTAYDNYDIFKADSAANTATGSVKTVITGASGYEFWQNAPAGNYHFIAKKTAGSLVLAGYKHQMLAAYVADTATIRLAPVTALNTLNITVHDTDNNAINDATVYLYTSSVVALLDTVRTAFTYSVSTSAAGTATKTNLPAATYHLYARKIIGSDTLAGTGSIFVPAAGTVNMPPLKIR
jgi:hypothetical protein